MKVWNWCWRCLGAGQLVRPGKLIPLEELNDRDRAELAVNGGWARKAEVHPCEKCEGTGRRRGCRR